MLRIALLAAVSVAAAVAAQPAVAADLPEYQPAPAYAAPAPASNWTGAYIGAQGGYSWAHSKNGAATPNTHPSGGLVGAYAGYDYQFDGSPVVVGVDTDLNYNFGDASRHFAGAGRVKNDLNWTGATRGRIGYGGDHVLVYGAGGVAYGEQKVSRRVGGAAPISGSDSKTAIGYTVGGGVEAKIADNVTARAEYRYNDYGSDKYKVGGGKVKSELTENRVTAGVAYKFSSW